LTVKRKVQTVFSQCFPHAFRREPVPSKVEGTHAYLISGFRWSFYGKSDVSVGVSLAMTLGFFLICLAVVGWIFWTGYRLKS
jgi:hypothetical protein